VLQTLLNNAQLLIVLAFVLLSVLGGIFRKVQEQREVQRRKTAADRARVEMLRTGRSMHGGGAVRPPMDPAFGPGPAPVGPPTSAAEALARLEEIARRRQDQMGKVRSAGQPQRRSTEPAGPVIVMGPSGPIVIRPGSSLPSGSAGVPAGRGKPAKPARQAQRAHKQAKPPSRPVPQAPAPPPPPMTAMEQARLTPQAAAQVTPPARAMMPGLTPRTPEEWRRLAAAVAVFGRPVGEGPGDATPSRLF